VEGDESHVDDSQLKISKFDQSQFQGKLATGEEDEEVLFSDRAKLYAMVGKEWKERATGPVKLSLVKSLGKVRFIIRTDKVLKVRANFLVDPAVALKPMPGSDKAWLWTALDFSDEDKPAGEALTLSIRLTTKEAADTFAAMFEKARDINRSAKGGAAPAAPAPKVAAAAAPAAAVAAAAATAVPEADKSGPVPNADSLEAIYTAAHSDAQATRYGAIAAAYRAAFGSDPAFFVRAPGRVNLIGEHIDYHGYSVLPMALGTQDVVIAGGAAAGGGFHVGNVNPKWDRATLPLDPTAPVGAETGVKWYKYVHCGYKGAFDFAKDKGLFTHGSEPKGINLMVDGAVPPGSWTSLYFDLLLLLVFEHCYPPPFPSLLTHSHTHTHTHTLT
jgi:hypothetical protein